MVGSSMVGRLIAQGALVTVLVQDWDTQSQLIRSKDIEKVNVVTGELEDIGALRRAINKFETDRKSVV